MQIKPHVKMLTFPFAQNPAPMPHLMSTSSGNCRQRPPFARGGDLTTGADHRETLSRAILHTAPGNAR